MIVTKEYIIEYNGLELSQKREAAGLSQEELAFMLGFSQPRQCKLEEPRQQTHRFTQKQYEVLEYIHFITPSY